MQFFSSPRGTRSKADRRKRARTSGQQRRAYRPLLEILEDRLALSAIVLNTNDSGSWSLRQAILDANATLGADLIEFNLAASDPAHLYYLNDNVAGQVSLANVMATTAATDAALVNPDPDWLNSWWKIRPLTGLPSLTTAGGPVEINGYSQPGASANTQAVGNDAVLRIELDGSLVTGAGLDIRAGGSTLQGLVVNRVVTSLHALRFSAGSGSVIQGSFIGTDVSGTLDHGNSIGVVVLALGNTIGGATPAARNVISGNNGVGISVSSAANSTIIQGNYIGTNAKGSAALKNDQGGISFGGANGLIGGTAPGAGNLISGNGISASGPGIAFAAAATGTRIEGNFIGTNADGTNAVGNTGSGIVIGVGGITVGGTAPGAGNVISGNLGDGVSLVGIQVGAPSSSVQGNWIGTQKDGVSALGNAMNGVLINGNTSNRNHAIGGLAPGAGNVIAFNGRNGVGIDGGIGHAVLSNSIYKNGTPSSLHLGINFGTAGNPPVPNDGPPADPDNDESINRLQNHPEMASATLSGTMLSITYKVPSSTLNATYPLTVQFFKADADRQEGQTLLYTDTYTTAQLNKTISFVPTAPLAAGDWIAATATDAAGNTSEFSAAVVVVSSNQPPTAEANGPYTVAEGGGVTLSSAGSADSDGTITLYEWDLDYNGATFTVDANGPSPVFSAASLDGLSSRTVALRVTDNAGAPSAVDTAVVTITNVAPTATFNVPSSVNEGSAIHVSLTNPADPSSADVAAGFTYAFDTGSGYGAFGAGNGASVGTTDNGSVTVKGKIRDKDGGVTEYTASVTVNNVAPTALNDSASTNEDQAVTIAVLTYDSDPAGALDPLRIDSVTNGSKGTTSIDTKGTPDTTDDEIVYTPNAGATGSDSFTYTISDGDGGTATAIVTVEIRNLVDLSGRVFDDKDNDGVYEPTDGEVGIGGVAVQLFNQTSGALIATRTTAADGSFSFDVNLAAGTYKIVAAQPAGLLDGRETAGNLGGAVDNSQDSNQITAISVGDPGTTADAIDYLFAEIRPSQAQGLVWSDFNNDGEVNFGERAIAGATVELTGLDERGNAVTQSTTSDANGVYAFIDLRPSNAAGYTLRESQPAGYVDGLDVLGQVNGVTVGNASVNDTFSAVAVPRPASIAENYNFGERPASDGGVTAGQTATIGFWQNKNGQNLINALNGGSTSTQLSNWLAATLPNMYGAGAGANNLTGKTNAQVAAFYKTLFARTAHSAAGGGAPKMDAQVMATALAVYVTNQTLAGTTAASYGFLVTNNGVGTRTFNVGSNGAAFGAENNSQVTVLDLLLAVNSGSRNGLLYDLDGDGDANDALETSYRSMANNVFSGINEAGDI